MDFITGIPIIPYDKSITELADSYQSLLKIPEKSKLDCFHLAVCVVTRIDYLLSWNFKHLGISTFAKLQKYNANNGLHTPLLLTPEALMEMEG